MSPPAVATRVLVCDDSRAYAAALRRLLQTDGTIEVVGVFSTAESAIAALPNLEPDLVTMDIELPRMSGLEAVEQIMSSQPVPILVISSHVGRNANAAAALGAGALEAVAKDDLDLENPAGVAAAAFRRRVQVLAHARVITHPRARLKAQRPPPATFRATIPAAVGIVASTGGPQALAAVLGALPADYPVPVLVVQHIAAGFGGGLASWLDGVAPPAVRLAAGGEELRPGVWIAPEGAHLVLDAEGRLALDRRQSSGLHRPSGNILLRSLAERAGPGAVAVVLSGMGSDGAEGVGAVRAARGLTIAQDEESSAIYGMPKAAAEQGAELILSLSEIGPALTALARRKT